MCVPAAVSYHPQASEPDVWRQLAQQLPAIVADQERHKADPKDDWDVNESLLRGYDADDTTWYDSWAESDTEEEDEVTDDSGAAEAGMTSESSGIDAYIELETDEEDEEGEGSSEESEADDSV